MVIDAQIPLLPLHTVLFPGTHLPLKIFEPRYTDMLRDCLRSGSEFGICLIREGTEVGTAAKTYEMGTIARIQDWDLRKDGLLGLSVIGDRRFLIHGEEVKRNQLLVAAVEYFDQESASPVPGEHHALVELLTDLIGRANREHYQQQPRFDDARWVGFRLAELLPLRLPQKQYFLQLDNPLLRLERIGGLLHDLGYLR